MPTGRSDSSGGGVTAEPGPQRLGGSHESRSNKGGAPRPLVAPDPQAKESPFQPIDHQRILNCASRSRGPSFDRRALMCVGVTGRRPPPTSVAVCRERWQHPARTRSPLPDCRRGAITLLLPLCAAADWEADVGALGALATRCLWIAGANVPQLLAAVDRELWRNIRWPSPGVARRLVDNRFDLA